MHAHSSSEVDFPEIYPRTWELVEFVTKPNVVNHQGIVRLGTPDVVDLDVRRKTKKDALVSTPHNSAVPRGRHQM